MPTFCETVSIIIWHSVIKSGKVHSGTPGNNTWEVFSIFLMQEVNAAPVFKKKINKFSGSVSFSFVTKLFRFCKMIDLVLLDDHKHTTLIIWFHSSSCARNTLSHDSTFCQSQCQVQEYLYNKRHCQSEWEDYRS